MEIKSAQRRSDDNQLRVMETIIIDDQQYNFGTVFRICACLNRHSPQRTTRITLDASVRQLLLTKKAIVPTPAYPPDHRLCRFGQGEAFVAFFDALMEAQQRLEEREPLNNPDPDSFLRFLDGESWGTDPAPDALGAPEDVLNTLRVNDFNEDEMTTVSLLLDTNEDFPYSIEMTPDIAVQCGELLYEMARPLVDEKPLAAPFLFSVQTEMEVIKFTANQERAELLLTGEEWEDAVVVMTPAQADEIAWQLREFGATIIQRTRGKAS